jgi:hypothetical protein
VIDCGSEGGGGNSSSSSSSSSSRYYCYCHKPCTEQIDVTFYSFFVKYSGRISTGLPAVLTEVSCDIRLSRQLKGL